MHFRFLLFGLILCFYSLHTTAQDCIVPLAILNKIDQTNCGPVLPPNGVAYVYVINSGDANTYTFQWYVGTTTDTPIANPPFNNDYSSTLINLSSGYYTVRVTNNQSGCSSLFTTYIAYQMDFPNASATVNCNGANSSAEIHITNPSPDGYYYYRWFSSDSFSPDSYIPGDENTLSGIGPGSYYAIVTNGASGCEQTVRFTVSSTQVKSDKLSLKIFDNVVCSGANGKIDVNVNDSGQQGNSFTWYAGADASSTPLSETSNVLSGLGEGFYTFKMVDLQSNCGVTTSAHINSLPDLPQVIFNFIPQTSCNVNAADGAIIALPKDQSESITDFNFNFLQSPPYLLNPPIINYSGDFVMMNFLPDGAYTISTTKPISGCESISHVTIPMKPEMPTLGNIMVTCPTDVGQSGSAQLTSISPGDFSDYTINWIDNGYIPVGSGSDVSGLQTGNYIVQATRLSSGCMASAEVSIVDQSSMSLSLTSGDQTSCDALTPSGSLTANVNGGASSDNSFEWHDGTDINSLVKSTQSSYTGLSAGDYTVVVTNSGCDFVKSASVSTNTTLPVINQLTTVANTSCISQNGSITAAVQMGTVNDYTFMWTDNASNNLSETGPVISGLSEGLYHVKAASKITKCESDVSQVTIFNASMIPVVGTIGVTAAACGQADGSLVVTAVSPGQTSDYTFAWYNAANLISGVTAADINGLTMGDYSVVAVNKISGCASEAASQSISCVTGIEKAPDNYFQIYPNPTVGDIHLTFSNPDSQKLTVLFSDISGKVRHSVETNGSELTVARSSMTAGLYIVQLQQGAKIYFNKVILN